MISINGLNFDYPDSQFQLHIPHLQLARYRSAAIAGPSGSGKTTLLNLIAGILPVNSGKIMVGETALHRLNDAERRLFRLRNIGLVFQDFQLIDYLTVLDNVLLPCRIHPSVSLTPDLRDRARALLDSAGLFPLLSRSVTQLSQGERQRTAICRALLLSPQLVLADEPTGNLDPVNSDRIVRLLLEEVGRSKATLIMVTHDHGLLRHFDEVVPFEQFLQRAESSTASNAERR